MLLTTALTCLALNIYYEGRGESELGKKIIAQTTLNRAKEEHSNVCSEVLKPNQFSWVNSRVNGRKLNLRARPKENDESWQTCQTIAKKALNGSLSVPTKYRNVTHFHNPRVKPSWTRNMISLGRVDGHYYYQAKQP